ncbi:hypothetical protein Y1Q_0014127 [Alligator mississippiensis]|uniref:Uncharacterized protein n=1 Tax=Alligator mississippiensis TaxID=8496 RepID=A0A151MRS4_ALLMI|nr:hypothetical protein Y1Q_0014127 [Alligator mississippiensis]
MMEHVELKPCPVGGVDLFGLPHQPEELFPTDARGVLGTRCPGQVASGKASPHSCEDLDKRVRRSSIGGSMLDFLPSTQKTWVQFPASAAATGPIGPPPAHLVCSTLPSPVDRGALGSCALNV